jgi:hypothetical protein
MQTTQRVTTREISVFLRELKIEREEVIKRMVSNVR